MWLHGPFPCGRFNDITIFRHLLSDCLEKGERVECDDGYWGEAPEQYVVPKHAWSRGGNKTEISQRVCARHETVNKRMKNFTCLDNFFATASTCIGYVFVLWLFLLSFCLKTAATF